MTARDGGKWMHGNPKATNSVRWVRGTVLPRLIVAVVLACLAMVSTTMVASHASGTSLARIVLEPNDLPSGFYPLDGGYSTNEQFAKEYGISAALVTKLGRVMGYNLDLARDTGRGMIAARSGVAQDRNSTAAHEWYLWYSKRDQDNARSFPGYHLYSSAVSGTLAVSNLCTCNDRHEVEYTTDSWRGDFAVGV